MQILIKKIEKWFFGAVRAIVKLSLQSASQPFLRALIAGFAITNFGCSHNLKIESEPGEANVFIVDQKGEKKVVGKTPLAMPMGEFKKILGETGEVGTFVTIAVEKPEFETQSLSIPLTGFGTLITELKVALKKGEKPAQEKLAHTLIEHLFLAQRFALSQQFERAHVEVDKVLLEFPKFARGLSMRGSIYFAQKNYNESLKWYEEALKIDSQMEDVVKMSAKAREMAGVPKSQTPTGGRGP